MGDIKYENDSGARLRLAGGLAWTETSCGPSQLTITNRGGEENTEYGVQWTNQSGGSKLTWFQGMTFLTRYVCCCYPFISPFQSLED